MVRITSILCRVPVIKFRKGSGTISRPAPASSASAPAAQPAQSAASAQPAAAMSTSAISDLQLPLKYRRRPLSQEEIDHINGGGIKQESSDQESSHKTQECVVTVNIPSKFIKAKGQKQVLGLNFVLPKTEK